MRYLSLFLLLLGACNSCTQQPETEVYFENLENNSKVPKTFLAKFGVRGMEVKPAGTDINNKKAGHHHILVDNEAGEIPEGTVIPMDAKNIHYGQGQSEGIVELSPGKHTLSLQFGDGVHRSYGKKLAKTITLFVAPE